MRSAPADGIGAAEGAQRTPPHAAVTNVDAAAALHVSGISQRGAAASGKPPLGRGDAGTGLRSGSPTLGSLPRAPPSPRTQRLRVIIQNALLEHSQGEQDVGHVTSVDELSSVLSEVSPHLYGRTSYPAPALPSPRLSFAGEMRSASRGELLPRTLVRCVA